MPTPSAAAQPRQEGIVNKALQPAVAGSAAVDPAQAVQAMPAIPPIPIAAIKPAHRIDLWISCRRNAFLGHWDASHFRRHLSRQRRMRVRSFLGTLGPSYSGQRLDEIAIRGDEKKGAARVAVQQRLDARRGQPFSNLGRIEVAAVLENCQGISSDRFGHGVEHLPEHPFRAFFGLCSGSFASAQRRTER